MFLKIHSIQKTSLIETLQRYLNESFEAGDLICESCSNKARYNKQKQEKDALGRNVNSSNNSHHAEEVESVTVENNYLAECTLTINNNNNDESNILNEENALTDLNNSESINMTTCKASSVGFDIHRISISHRKCCICKKESYDKKSNKHHKLQLVSHFAIINAFKKTKILIPYGARCCRNHFKNDFINDDAISF